MNSENNFLIDCSNKQKIIPKNSYTKDDAIKEFDELKNIALNCYDKNGNPNVSAALRAIENKAKIAGLYSQIQNEAKFVVNMNDITIDGEQLKFNIGEDFS